MSEDNKFVLKLRSAEKLCAQLFFKKVINSIK